ncbi:RrF2 family transcriptional regulator [Lachnospiraceae bacterium LCP25S3_G4]
MTGEFSIAVHALVYLHHKECTLSSELLAENICTNPARVRKIMSKLKKPGFITTKEGIDGGYSLHHNPETLTLRNVIDALDSKIVSSSWHSGDSDMECLVASGMANIMDELYEDLDNICRERLDHITVADITNKIFG